VLRLSESLHQTAKIQLVAATHSPLILASAEPFFDEGRDAWFDLDLEYENGKAFAHLRRRDFVRRGDVSNWLASEAFDLKKDCGQARRDPATVMEGGPA
jgi:hypothetical protein